MIPKMLSPLWTYRGFILGSVKREFQSKYRNSLLGAAWTVLNPMAMILVYTVIFSRMMRAKMPGSSGPYSYSLYLCAGLLPWGLFTEIVSRAISVFFDNANMIKKLNFPKLCLPMILIGSALLNFGIIFGVFTGFLLLSGNFPGLPYLGILPLLLVLILFSIGLGVIFGVLNVFFRDVGQMFSIVLQFWFWLTPIVYSPAILPEQLHKLLQLNPLFGLMTGFQSIIVSGHWPDWPTLWPVTVLSLLLCLGGLVLFRRHAGEMVDEL